MSNQLAREALEAVEVSRYRNDPKLRVLVKVPGRGFWTAEIHDDGEGIFLAWEEKRQAALTALSEQSGNGESLPIDEQPKRLPPINLAARLVRDIDDPLARQAAATIRDLWDRLQSLEQAGQPSGDEDATIDDDLQECPDRRGYLRISEFANNAVQQILAVADPKANPDEEVSLAQTVEQYIHTLVRWCRYHNGERQRLSSETERLRERVKVLEHVLRRFCPDEAPCCCDDWMALDSGDTKCVYCVARAALATEETKG